MSGNSKDKHFFGYYAVKIQAQQLGFVNKWPFSDRSSIYNKEHDIMLGYYAGILCWDIRLDIIWEHRTI